MHYRRHDITGRLYKICMRWTQLELGFPAPFYTYKYNSCKMYITTTIVTDLWEYLSDCNATIIEQTPWVHTAPRHNDFFLNHTVSQSSICKEHDIVAIASGTKILPNILSGINNRQSTLHWPNSLAFPPAWISIWAYILNTIVQPRLQASPLGSWVAETHQTWLSTISYSHQIISFNNKYHKLKRASRTPTFAPTVGTYPCPLNADILVRNNELVLLSSGTTYNPLPPPLPPSTAWEFICAAPTW